MMTGLRKGKNDDFSNCKGKVTASVSLSEKVPGDRKHKQHRRRCRRPHHIQRRKHPASLTTYLLVCSSVVAFVFLKLKFIIVEAVVDDRHNIPTTASRNSSPNSIRTFVSQDDNGDDIIDDDESSFSNGQGSSSFWNRLRHPKRSNVIHRQQLQHQQEQEWAESNERTCNLLSSSVVQLQRNVQTQQWERVVPSLWDEERSHQHQQHQQQQQQVIPQDIIWARECWCARGTSIDMDLNHQHPNHQRNQNEQQKHYCLAQYDVCHVTTTYTSADAHRGDNDHDDDTTTTISCYTWNDGEYEDTVSTVRSLMLLGGFWLTVCTLLMMCTTQGRLCLAYMRRCTVVLCSQVQASRICRSRVTSHKQRPARRYRSGTFQLLETDNDDDATTDDDDSYLDLQPAEAFDVDDTNSNRDTQLDVEIELQDRSVPVSNDSASSPRDRDRSSDGRMDIPSEFGSAANFRQLLSDFYHLNDRDPESTTELWYSAVYHDPRLYQIIQGGTRRPRSSQHHQQQRQEQHQASLSSALSTTSTETATGSTSSQQPTQNTSNRTNAVTGRSYTVIPPPHIRPTTNLYLKTKRYKKVFSSSGGDCDDDTKEGEDDPVCSICLCDVEDGDVVGALNCQHLLHKDCLKVWLVRQNKCPLCQQLGVATSRTSLTVGTAFDIDTWGDIVAASSTSR